MNRDIQYSVCAAILQYFALFTLQEPGLTTWWSQRAVSHARLWLDLRGLSDPFCSHVSGVAAPQVPEPGGDVHRHGRGVVRLPGLGVGRREQSRHQQLQEAEPHGVRGRRHGRQLHAGVAAGERHGLYVCDHPTPDL